MKNGKLFSKLSLIDALVIAVILLLVIVTAVRFCGFSTADKAAQQTTEQTVVKEKCRITMRFDNVSGQLLRDPFFEGQPLTQKNKTLGTLISYQKVPFVEQVVLQNGKTITTKSQNAYTYTVVLEATLDRSEGERRTAAGEAVGVGKSFTVSSQLFSLKGTVIGVEKIQ